MRIGFLCMESVFSVRPLEALLAAGHDVRFVMRPMGGVDTRTKGVIKRHRGFDVAVKRALGFARVDDDKRNPLLVAARAEIPAYIVGNASCGPSVSVIKREKVDLLVIAFFNQLLKRELLAVPSLGAVNLHPSLLPQYRGPAPLFWTYRDGCAHAGLTLHRVAPGEDDGDILAQESVPVSLGLAGEDLVDELATRAAAMTVSVVNALEHGTSKAVPQNPERVTRAPRPTEQDLCVDASMGARRAFQFVRGVGRWNPVYVDVGGQRVRVIDAIELQEGQRMPGESAVIGELLHLGCEDGVVVLRTRMTP